MGGGGVGGVRGGFRLPSWGLWVRIPNPFFVDRKTLLWDADRPAAQAGLCHGYLPLLLVRSDMTDPVSSPVRRGAAPYGVANWLPKRVKSLDCLLV